MLKNIPYQIKSIKNINKGLTNENFLIEIDNKKYMLRYPKADTKALFNRKHEKEIIKQLKNQPYTLDILYYEDGLQIVKYEKSLLNFDEYQHFDKIKKVANLMKQFHNSKIKVDFNFEPLKQINLYKQYVKNSEIDLSQYQTLFNKLKNHDFQPILCHNDWVAGNICFIDNQTYLIDFEYAGNNDPYFDIMSFITENDLTDKQKSEFLNYMFDNINEQTEEILMMYRDINNILWYYWALMMYELRKETIYLEISKIKLKQFKLEYNQRLDYV